MDPGVLTKSNFSGSSDDSNEFESDHGKKKQGYILSLKESDDTEGQDSIDCSDDNDDGKEGKDKNTKQKKIPKKITLVMHRPNCMKMKAKDKKDEISSENSESEGESELESEDESESESDSDSDGSNEEEKDDFDHQWEELRNEAPDTNEATRRIAVCNMDWDRIRATDLLVCFNSFKPPNGTINSVKIYPSEFGLKRMEEEKLKGPPELVEETLPLDEEEEVDDKKGSKYHREKLRQYQISRLRYYYAVVDCDSPQTANTLYEQLNGMEYESSSVKYDLRFIPDDVTFDQEPTSVADKVPDEYKPRLFVTSALQQVKVDLTWDETDPKRREFFQKVFTSVESVENDINDYLASASSESEEEIDMADDESGKKLKTAEKIAKYKDLLKSLEEKEKKEDEKYDVEITWEPSLKEKTEQKVKEKIKKDSLNPFEEMLQKKKDQKKMKKAELTQKQNEDHDDSEEETSSAETKLKSENDKLAELALISDYQKETESENKLKKKKNKSEELNGFVPDMNDPRFSAMYTSSLFNMVTSNQHSKKNDGNFGSKRQKGGKFKPSKGHESHKSAKRARY